MLTLTLVFYEGFSGGIYVSYVIAMSVKFCSWKYNISDSLCAMSIFRSGLFSCEG